ncbi:MAG: Smr/MutS family protein [Bacteroidales bacterium]|jgi:DNA mismatch repair protein MutS2|nr:Smr/MutS family protein [Bacteroidales bacterium]MDD3100546.1 Smr/MutS family protein [Bacteroidales bacterium]MDD3639439.1 Smr/MutS family protein [Bacteroidales bacterium]MDD3944117.1 Smr/MutS family protein [Bacteroidales bacterium]MDD4480743.1 Smr/MutS family protein [Bacteroidales bacterium]
MIYPAGFEQKIGFDRIREMLLQQCMSSAGRELVEHMVFLTHRASLEEELDRTAEMHRICLLEQQFPESGYEDTLLFLRQMESNPAYYPDLSSLVRLQISVQTVKALLLFFSGVREGSYPALKRLCEPVTFFPAIAQRLDSLLDKFGEIRDNASPDLAEIRKSLKRKEQQVIQKIQSVLKESREQGITEPDASVSVHEGRMLIPVPAGNKKKIQGYICDESATGKTVFIEPMEVVNLNNQIRELGFAEQREITKILLDFAAFLRPYVPDLIVQAGFLGTIDFLRAKARTALKMQAGKPVLTDEQGLFLLRARHPLLEAALLREGKTIVPLTLKLDSVRRILLISGPNAGGKSVCLKTVGLLQYMLQCGMLVPASETSEFCLFSSLFLDIGDEQSLDNDLSTYSSHLLSMKETLDHADSNSLVLIDEFGAGTEPAAGGAIAEALLEQWEQRGCFAVITTHYTNLKFYATTSKSVLNGAMQFDVQHIQPLFKLETGVPGNSFAFELARKMGLPSDLIRKAQEKAGAGFVETERYIRSIARNRKKWEEKVARIKQTDKTLDTITDKYQTELSEIRSLRKKMIDQARTEALRIVDEANRKVENTIREIRESQAEKEKTKNTRNDLQQFRQEMARETTDREEQKIFLKMEQLRKRKEESEKRKQKRERTAGEEKRTRRTNAVKEDDQKPLGEGDKVRTRDGMIVGEILRISGKKANVGMGQIVTRVDLSSLERISQNEYRSHLRVPVSAARSIPEDLSAHRLNFSPHLDVRGMRADEATARVTRFLDDAMMVGIGQVDILHGTGTGVLRKEIRNYLKTAPGVASFEDEHVERGGPGITVVYLE